MTKTTREHQLVRRPSTRRSLFVVLVMVLIYGAAARNDETIQGQNGINAAVFAKDFSTSPWMMNQAPFVIYRLVVATISLSFLLVDVLRRCKHHDEMVDWITRYTNWGLTLLVLHFCWSAVLTYNYHVSPTLDQQAPLQWHHHLSKAIYSTALSPCLAIFILYWFVIPRKGPGTVIKHGCNTFLAIFDVFVSGYPIYMGDVIYPACMTLAYTLFITWMWKMGFHPGDYYPPQVDFTKGMRRPISSSVRVALIVQPTFHVVFYVLYCVREWLL